MKFFTALFVVFCLFSCVTVTKAENTGAKNTSEDKSVENTSKITGRVQIYGNEPHTYVGIIDENDVEYLVTPPSVGDELRKLQGRLIEFTVVIVSESPSMFLKGGTVKPVEWKIIR